LHFGLNNLSFYPFYILSKREFNKEKIVNGREFISSSMYLLIVCSISFSFSFCFLLVCSAFGFSVLLLSAFGQLLNQKKKKNLLIVCDFSQFFLDHNQDALSYFLQNFLTKSLVVKEDSPLQTATVFAIENSDRFSSITICDRNCDLSWVFVTNVQVNDFREKYVVVNLNFHRFHGL